MKLYRAGVLAGLLASAVALAACSSSSNAGGSSTTPTGGSTASSTQAAAPTCSSGKLNAQGSTAQTNAINQWIKDYQTACPGATVNYNPTGSGAGVTAFIAKQDDFVGSDSALSPSAGEYTKAQAACGSAPMDLPMVVGPIAVAYKLSNVSSLVLDGPTIAKIFLGKIKTWNDPAIKALNPGLSLPSTAITVVHRSDSSGTTKGFTTFLADTSPTWKSQVGADKDVKWPTGTGAAKNAGVAAAIKQTPGAIGYVEQAYALENGFTYAAIKNSKGQFVSPTIANTSLAAQGIAVPKDLGISTINSPASGAYPIVSQTFLDSYADPCKDGGANAATASGLKKVLTYAFGAGQQTLGSGGNKLPYAPLPSSLAAKDNAQLAQLMCNGKAIS